MSTASEKLRRRGGPGTLMVEGTQLGAVCRLADWIVGHIICLQTTLVVRDRLEMTRLSTYIRNNDYLEQMSRS